MPKLDHCITCGHPIPAGEDHPHYFARYATRDREAVDFIFETRTLANYLLAVCDAILELSDSKDLDTRTLSTLFGSVPDVDIGGFNVLRILEIKNHRIQI